MAARWLRGSLKGYLVQVMGYIIKLRGRPVLNSKLPQLFRKASAHQGNDLGDGNNA